MRKRWRHRVGGVLLAFEALAGLGTTAAISMACSAVLVLGAGLAFCGTRWRFVRWMRVLAAVAPGLPLLFLLLSDKPHVKRLLIVFIICLVCAGLAILLLKELDFTLNPMEVVVRETRFMAWLVLMSNGLSILLFAAFAGYLASKGLGAGVSNAWQIHLPINVVGLIGGVSLLARKRWGRYLCVASAFAAAVSTLSPMNMPAALTSASFLMPLCFSLILVIALFHRKARLYYEERSPVEPQ